MLAFFAPMFLGAHFSLRDLAVVDAVHMNIAPRSFFRGVGGGSRFAHCFKAMLRGEMPAFLLRPSLCVCTFPDAILQSWMLFL